MSTSFDSLDQAFMVLADSSSPAWGDAFRFLSSHPETARVMLDTFRETLEQMGIAPSGTDTETGEPAYRLADIASAMGIPEDRLDEFVEFSES